MMIIRAFQSLVVACWTVSIAATLAAAQEREWDLKPLSYNDSDAVVDLGVGLWAYPVPVDYDLDGDLDLLVSCPDKPSPGTYYFENPTGDPSIKMPVFKPAVRVGPGSHYMLGSKAGDDVVILLPGKQFDRDPATGRFDFDKPKKLGFAANQAEIKGEQIRANMWRSVDYEGDGDRDLLMGLGDWSEYGWDHAYNSQGRWENGPLHGYVRLVLNEGTDETPQYAREATPLSAAGSAIDVYGWPCPDLADFDGDGDLDLLCGEFLDGFTYFENLGSREHPSFTSGRRLVDAAGNRIVMDLQMITPTAVDWDRDGDQDLIVGDEDGRVAFVEHTGRLQNGLPVFIKPRYFRQQADTLKFGALATPYVYDWDRDGDEDILSGNTAGMIGWFENLGAGSDGLPKWSPPVALEAKADDGDARAPFRLMAGASGSIQGPCEAKWGYTSINVADWDGDGDGDIIANSILGRLLLLINEDGFLVPRAFDTGLREAPPVWSWDRTPASDTLTQWRTTPVVVDFDGDETLDLVMLDQEGYLTLRRGGREAERIFVDETGTPWQLNDASCGASGRVKLAVVDWDGDGRLDVLTNSENALWYRNCATQDGSVVLKKIGNLAHRNIGGHTCNPSVCDFDRDGKPDLVIGSENGRFYHIAHDDCIQYSESQTALAEPADPPTMRFPGLVLEEMIFDGKTGSPSHASTICETSRGLVAAWFGGAPEGDPSVTIWTSYHDGKSWRAPQQVADGVQHAGLRYPCWNPVLFQTPGDGPTLLFFKVGPNPAEWWGELLVSYDRGRTFVDRKRLPEGILGPIRSKPVLLPDGRLLCGSSTENDGWRVHFESIRLRDGLPEGTWERTGPVPTVGGLQVIQPTLLTIAEGKLLALSRTRGNGIVAATSSDDGGQSWTPITATELPNPNSGIEGLTLAYGPHLLVANPVGNEKTETGSRGLLQLFVSEDGKDWQPLAELERENGAEFSYPAAIQSSDGLVHITYTWKRQRIKHVVLDARRLRPDPTLNNAD